MRAVLFDLDDTLIVEVPIAREAFIATAAHAAARHAVDVERLATDARLCARELWHGGPHQATAERIAISSWEGLWCRYEGDDPDVRALRAWAPGYRAAAWDAGLRRQGIEDAALAEQLGERFGVERRAIHRLLPGAAELLTDLGRDHDIGLVTNGASCLQREKLEASGLAGHFHAVVVSADLRTRKPDPAVFRRALELLGATADEAVMVGDNPDTDIAGARATGMRAVHVSGADHEPVAGVAFADSLADVAALIRAT